MQGTEAYSCKDIAKAVAALLLGIDGGSPMRMAEVRLGDEGKAPDRTSRPAPAHHLTPAGQPVALDTAAAALAPLSHFASHDGEAAPNYDCPMSIVILSDVRFIRDALVSIFVPHDRFNVLGACAEFSAAFEGSIAPDIVLIDAAIPDGFAMVRRIRQFAPKVRIVALALAEREDTSCSSRTTSSRCGASLGRLH